MNSEARRRCHHCGTRLGLLTVKCPYCRRPAVNWMHRLFIAAFAVSAVVLVLRVF
jgi:hypothetical protein